MPHPISGNANIIVYIIISEVVAANRSTRGMLAGNSGGGLSLLFT